MRKYKSKRGYPGRYKNKNYAKKVRSWAIELEEAFKEEAKIHGENGSSDEYGWWKISNKYFSPDRVEEAFGVTLDKTIQEYTFTESSHLASWWQWYYYRVEEGFKKTMPIRGSGRSRLSKAKLLGF